MKLSPDDYNQVLSLVPIVCVDCIVVNDRGEYLLVRRANEPFKSEFWIPGGRVYKNERLINAVHRKMREEIGVEVEIIRNVGFFEEFLEKTAQDIENGAHTVSIVYLVKPKNLDIKIDGQSSEWAWFNELPAKFKEYVNLKLDPVTMKSQ